MINKNPIIIIIIKTPTCSKLELSGFSVVMNKNSVLIFFTILTVQNDFWYVIEPKVKENLLVC
jgi:hypothetical protein